MLHASSSSSTPLLPLRRFTQKREEKNNSRPPSSISSSSSSPIRLLHRRIAIAVFADSPKEQRTKPSPLRRFADSPIRLLHRFLFADSRSKREKNTSQRRHTTLEEAFVAPIRQSVCEKLDVARRSLAPEADR
ncbi:hypothetical protein Syun_003627 [Stephania yunnanensis]|uniref:Uncharacterized protein n=1 Tax=Stephania yunnanensis TaxID=152371 RepID=A0AAP0L2H8_9MAGN